MKRIPIAILIMFMITITNSCIVFSMTNTDPLIIGMEANNPPFEFIDEEGEYRGFNIDIIKALSLEMEVDIVLKPMDWVDVHVALQNGEIDAILGMNFNENRKELYEFSDEYLVHSLALFVNENNNSIFDIENLKGCRVAVQRSDFAAYVLADIGEIELVFFSDLYVAFKALMNNKVDAVFGNKLTGKYLIRHNEDIKNVKIVGNEYNFSSYGLALRKGNTQLAQEFNMALKEIKQKGIYNKIYSKWFGKDLESSYLRLLKIITIFSIIFFGIIIIVVKINNSLKKQVERRTLELRKANAKLLKQKQLIKESNIFKEQILNGIANGLITFDKNKVITAINKSCEKILDINSKDWIGKNIESTYLNKYFNVDIIKECIDTGMKFDYLESKFVKDDREVTLSYILRPMFNMKDERIGAVMTFHDITELSILREKVAEREKMNTINMLISGISHEIRNPLTTIKTYIDLLPYKYDNEEFRNKITRQVPLEISRLNELLTDLINLTKPKKLKKEKFNLIDLVNYVLDIFSIKLEKANISYNYLDKDKEILVYGNKQQILQIIMNLILNSIEAIEENGKIVLKINRLNNKYILRIIDNGQGIEEKHMKKILDPFFSTKKSGTGLGLTMCYRYAKENNIQLKIISEYGKGTEVELTFDVYTDEGEGCNG
ncbi:MAG: transporter substrate-binding domain-containing protein [Tissierellia bacterium]|nr:transporter substrate-binding domain-containing protein [Tissierellia bacterium]